MAKKDGYSILCSFLNEEHINVDMLIIKPSLYAYIPEDEIDSAKKSGLKADENNLIQVYFTRIPQNLKEYSDYLDNHIVVRISISKLEKVKDQKIKIRPVNMDIEKTHLDKDDIEKIIKNNSLFFKYFKQGKDLDDIPHAAIYVEKGILPSFTFKVIDDDHIEEMSLKTKIAARIAKAVTSKAGRDLARQARRSPGAYKALATNIAGVKYKGPMSRRVGTKVINRFKIMQQ